MQAGHSRQGEGSEQWNKGMEEKKSIPVSPGEGILNAFEVARSKVKNNEKAGVCKNPVGKGNKEDTDLLCMNGAVAAGMDTFAGWVSEEAKGAAQATAVFQARSREGAKESAAANMEQDPFEKHLGQGLSNWGPGICRS